MKNIADPNSIIHALASGRQFATEYYHKMFCYPRENFDKIHHTDVFLKSALHVASDSSNFPLEKELINCESLFFAKESTGETPLIYVLRSQSQADYVNRIKTVKRLLRLGAEIDEMDKSKHTSLFYAAVKRSLKICKFFLSSWSTETSASRKFLRYQNQLQ